MRPCRPDVAAAHAVVAPPALDSVASLSRLSDSFAVWRDKIYPPNRSALCKCHMFSCDEHVQRLPRVGIRRAINEESPVIRPGGLRGHRSADCASECAYPRMSRRDWLQPPYTVHYSISAVQAQEQGTRGHRQNQHAHLPHRARAEDALRTAAAREHRSVA